MAVTAWRAEQSAPTADTSTFHLARGLFLRSLGLVYLVAFVSLWTQVHGLLGERGILPAGEFLDLVATRIGPERYWLVPTLAWLGAGDRGLDVLCGVGTALACLLAAGIAPGPCLLGLWALYLSLVTIGRVFLGYQWDALLLETGVLAMLLAPWRLRPAASRVAPPAPLALFLVRWLLFRLMFCSGVVKLLGDDPRAPTWRTLTALAYHYQTQCLPTWVAWYAHQLPLTFHKFSCAVMFAIELAVPFLVFTTRRGRQVAFVAFVTLQLLIMATGNYTFFNWLAITLCLPLLDDRALARALPARLSARLGSAPSGTPETAADTRAFGARAARAVLAVSTVVLVATSSLVMLRQVAGRAALPVPGRRWLEWLEPLRSVNGYGLFARMTTVRNEIVLEGSDDGVTWQAYEFRWKPGDVMRRPAFVAPHQPRLDWQMWFAALTRAEANPDQWFARLERRLLQGSPDVLALLAVDPFPAAPPRYVRAVVYQYHFTDWTTGADGAWWRREPRGLYAAPASLP